MSEMRRSLASTKPGYEYTHGRVLVIYGSLMIVVMLTGLDQTIVATALPHIVSDIGGIRGYSWVFNAYLLTLAVAVPLYGRLGDSYGRRALLLSALGIFLVGSAACGLAGTMPELVAARALQGVGAGGLMPLVQSTIADVVPIRERGRYQALVGTSFAAASVAGPIIGGLIVDHSSWRWAFLLNVPICVAALAAVALTLPRRVARSLDPIDYAGAFFLAAGVGALFIALSWHSGGLAWGSASVVYAFAASAVAFVLLVARERRVQQTILPFETLRLRPVAITCVCALLVAACQFGAIAYIPLFAQGVIGTSATVSGFALTPLLFGVPVGANFAGQLITRTGRYRSR
jgi:EmrB/QacA subfamily drug resistance transporter